MKKYVKVKKKKKKKKNFFIIYSIAIKLDITNLLIF